MAKPSGAIFTPPTAEQIDAHLKKCAPAPPARWVTMLPLIALALVVMLAFSSLGGVLAMLLPGLVLIALVFGLSWRVRSLRAMEVRVTRVQELALTRHHAEALRLSWRMLPQLRTLHELHGRVVSMMAFALDQVGAHDAAIVVYDFLIERLPPSHPGCIQLSIQRTIVQLMADRLTDADDALRRLRSHAASFGDTPIGATYRLAELLQQVRTNHFRDAVETTTDLVKDLRPLGVEAGYGYALMAFSHHMIGDEGADEWWHRATLLLSPSALVGRFDQLNVLTALPAAPRPKAVSAT